MLPPQPSVNCCNRKYRMIIWITGITASGKSTLSLMLYNKLKTYKNLNILRLDGDELRDKRKFYKGHDIKTRWKNLKIIVDIIKAEIDEYDIILISTVSHVKEMRDYARKNLSDFHEVHLNCDSKVCEDRDFKGLYKKIRQMKLNERELFPGLTAPYEVSLNPELIINTGELDINSSFNKLFSYVKKFKGI
ncbi:adenylyl-sulfate kinase [Pelagibacteraceae bacterium]|nr:adenylyl-sulfate kinase [Pelagibacteraceae bacterium]